MIKAFLSIKNKILRQCLQRVFEDEGIAAVVGHSGGIDGIVFVDAVPDILIIEFVNHSIDLTRLEMITRENPDIRTLAIGNDLTATDYSGLINAGVNGCLDSSADLNELFVVIRNIMVGKIHFPHEVLSRIMNNSKEPDKNAGNLTFREIEVLTLLCDGLTNEQISERLHLSYDTVKWHRSNILIKCSCKNVLALYKYAVRNKLIEVSKVE